DEADELEDLIDMTDEAPVIRWVNNLFYTSVRERASDIHVEPTDKEVVVRYRIDGRLVPRKSAPKSALPNIIARIKIESGLNIAEKRLPQDGRISKKIAGKVVDVRVSTIPTAKGERVVMRLLDKQNIMLELGDLGFAKAQLDVWQRLIRRPDGIVLVTGPTGSGKTTTLYGSLNQINTPEKNILTVEDPVEYELKGIGQMQIQPKIGLTFASGLRAFLRQDPDVIMVGEIRDHETADIAIHASLTGHLVLSTLHTNDAPTAVTRLVDMGIQPFQISSSVLAVLAQRLVRRLCPKCRKPYHPTLEDLAELGLEGDDVEQRLAELQRLAASTVIGGATIGSTIASSGAGAPSLPGDEVTRLAANPLEAAHPFSERPVFYHPGGCEECTNGYRGRMGIYELMVIDGGVRREILNNSDSKTIQRAAHAGGMRMLREDGARQVIAGITSVEEVLAATQAGGLD
ncbi:MAG: ATPase, T2SS/T4P/T4SS family, partial [Myxococcales bacterium]|nr:ATPase, T2SS/T4P/T4SS family [Myxococcales bacterium]